MHAPARPAPGGAGSNETRYKKQKGLERVGSASLCGQSG
jgi:hypothetical protein